MTIIGLTGGIGSGKSTVLSFFKKLGAAIFIADEEAKKLMLENPVLKNEIIDLFGEKAYDSNNKLNRKYISSIAFSDKEKLKLLNGLVHPKVRERFQHFLKGTSAEIIVYEAAILFESGNAQSCDYVVTITAAIEERIHRVMKRDGVSKELVLQRMHHQTDDTFKIKKSHFVIQNNEIKATKEQVKTIFDIIYKQLNN